jgi:hypothetical protein
MGAIASRNLGGLAGGLAGGDINEKRFYRLVFRRWFEGQ